MLSAMSVYKVEAENICQWAKTSNVVCIKHHVRLLVFVLLYGTIPLLIIQVVKICDNKK